MRVSHLLALLALCTGAVHAETELKGLAGLREEAKAGIEMKLGDLLSVEEEEELENEADATGRRRRRRRRRWGHGHNPHHHNPHHHRPHHHNPHSHRPHSHRPHSHAPHSHAQHGHAPHSHNPHTHKWTGKVKEFMKKLANFGDWAQKVYKNRNKAVSNAGPRDNGMFNTEDLKIKEAQDGRDKAKEFVELQLKGYGLKLRGGCNGRKTKDRYGHLSKCEADPFDPSGDSDGTVSEPGKLTNAGYRFITNAKHPSQHGGQYNVCRDPELNTDYRQPIGCLWQGLDGQDPALYPNTYTSAINPRTPLGNSAPANMWARYSMKRTSTAAQTNKAQCDYFKNVRMTLSMGISSLNGGGNHIDNCVYGDILGSGVMGSDPFAGWGRKTYEGGAQPPYCLDPVNDLCVWNDPRSVKGWSHGRNCDCDKVGSSYYNEMIANCVQGCVKGHALADCDPVLQRAKIQKELDVAILAEATCNKGLDTEIAAVAAGVPRITYDDGAVAEMAFYFQKKSNMVEKRSCKANGGYMCARIYFHKQHAVGKAKVYAARYKDIWGARIVRLPSHELSNDRVEDGVWAAPNGGAEERARNKQGYIRKQYAMYESYSAQAKGESTGNALYLFDTRGAKDPLGKYKAFYGISNIVWFNNFNSVMSNDAVVMHAEKAFFTDGHGTIEGMSHGLLEENATAERTTTEAAAENLELYESYVAELEAKEASLGSLLEKKAAAGSTVAWESFQDDLEAAGNFIVDAADWVEDRFNEMGGWLAEWADLFETLDKILTERDRVEAAILSQARVAMQLVEGSKDHDAVSRLQGMVILGAAPCGAGTCARKDQLIATARDTARRDYSVAFRNYAKTPDSIRFTRYRYAYANNNAFCAYGWWANTPTGERYWKCLYSEDTCFHFEDDAISPSPAFSMDEGTSDSCDNDDSASGKTCYTNGYMEIPINKRLVAFHATVEFSPERSFQMLHGTVSVHDDSGGIGMYYEATTHEVIVGAQSQRKEAAYEARFYVSTAPQFCNALNFCGKDKDGRTTLGYINDIEYPKLFGLIKTGNSFGRRILFTAYEKIYATGEYGMGKFSKELKGRNFDRWNHGLNCNMQHFEELESKFDSMRDSNIGYAAPGVKMSDWITLGGMGDYFDTIAKFLDLVAETAMPYGCASSFMRGVARTPFLEDQIGRENANPAVLSAEQKEQNNDYDAFEMAVWAHFMAECPKNIKLTDIADRNWGGDGGGLGAIWNPW